MVSGSISPVSPTCFSPFPHGTKFTIGHLKYLALAGNSANFPQCFLSSRYSGKTHKIEIFFVYGTFTLFGGLFQNLRLKISILYSGFSSNPLSYINIKIGFRLFPVRSPLLRKYRLVSFPLGTKMFHFPRFAHGLI